MIQPLFRLLIFLAVLLGSGCQATDAQADATDTQTKDVFRRTSFVYNSVSPFGSELSILMLNDGVRVVLDHVAPVSSDCSSEEIPICIANREAKFVFALPDGLEPMRGKVWSANGSEFTVLDVLTSSWFHKVEPFAIIQATNADGDINVFYYGMSRGLVAFHASAIRGDCARCLNGGKIFVLTGQEYGFGYKPKEK